MGILTIKKFVDWCHANNRKPSSIESVIAYDKERGFESKYKINPVGVVK